MEHKKLCPHCSAHTIPTGKIAKDVVAIFSCPGCEELLVLFRNRVIPLKRRVIEEGSFEERKEHLATVIAEFLEAGFLQEQDGAQMVRPKVRFHRATDEGQEMDDDSVPISEQELDKFTRIDLKCLDNSAYFRRHFG